MGKTILFIDGENFLKKVKYVLKKEGIRPNKYDATKIKAKELVNSAFKDISIDEYRFYSAKLRVQKETKEKSHELIQRQRRLKTNLEKQGFNFILAGNVRNFNVKVDGQSKTIFKEKGIDVKIAVDLVSLACDKKLKTAIICSSDSDLQPAIEELKKRGVKVIYLGFGILPNKGLIYTSDENVLFRAPEIVNSVVK